MQQYGNQAPSRCYWCADTEHFASYLECIPESIQLIVVEEKVYLSQRHLLPTQELTCYSGGESIKELHILEDILRAWLAKGLHRNGGAIVAVGGGAFLDSIGFAASVYHRGLPTIYVPTTLLAMIDASIGGKTGINFEGYKNILGTFHTPKAIIFDLKFLESLPHNAWAEGFAEIIKYACIADTHLFDELKQHDLSYYQSHARVLEKLVKKCVAIKEKFVTEDLYEAAHTRVLLNFGHSFAHALEHVCKVSHGEAVACGMMFSVWLSIEVQQLVPQKYKDLEKLLRQYQLSTFRKVEPQRVFEAYTKDKKQRTSTWEEILLDDWGRPHRRAFSAQDLRNYIEKYFMSV